MYYYLERVLGNPIALILSLVIGGSILFWLKKREDARRALRDGAGGSGVEVPVRTGSISRPAPPSTGTRPGIEMPDAAERPTPGFRELVWGDPPPAAMTLYHQDGDEALFTRASDVLRLGGVPITSITYSFYRSRFQGVSIELPDMSAGSLHRYLVSQWGEPKQPNPQAPKYYWPDLLKGAEATQAVFEKMPISRKATLIISSKVIREQKEKDKVK